MRRGGSLWFSMMLLATSACFPVRYVAQATRGQVDLLLKARPLGSVVHDPRTAPRVADLLSWVPELKRFGTSNGLTPTQNYTRFTQLDRTAAVWVVQACAALAFEPKRWSFPIVGTVPYLGFFDEKDARAFAGELSVDPSLDVDVRGAAAYSTLGWFRDPVLSTMLSDDDDALGELANTVLHESLHATLYITGQSAFDESLASFVGDHLTLEWLTKRFGASSREVRAWTDGQRRSTERIARLHTAYETLDALYRSGAAADELRARKAEIFAALEKDLGARRRLNNATLMGFRIYDTGNAAFEHLFIACGKDWRVFLTALRSLRDDDFPKPQTEDFSPVVESLAARVNRHD